MVNSTPLCKWLWDQVVLWNRDGSCERRCKRNVQKHQSSYRYYTNQNCPSKHQGWECQHRPTQATLVLGRALPRAVQHCRMLLLITALHFLLHPHSIPKFLTKLHHHGGARPTFNNGWAQESYGPSHYQKGRQWWHSIWRIDIWCFNSFTIP